MSTQSQRITHCYFCNSTTHNIKSCSDEKLVNFKQYCISLKEAYQTSIIETKKKFIQTLSIIALNDYINLVKAFAINKCGARRIDNIEICIDKITNYIFNLEVTNNRNENLMIFIRLDDSCINENENENDTNNTQYCIVCMEDKKEDEFVKFICNHEFCAHCVKNILKPNTTIPTTMERYYPVCPLCRLRITTMIIKNIDTHTIIM
jgi:hypothetical protein